MDSETLLSGFAARGLVVAIRLEAIEQENRKRRKLYYSLLLGWLTAPLGSSA